MGINFSVETNVDTETGNEQLVISMDGIHVASFATFADAPEDNTITRMGLADGIAQAIHLALPHRLVFRRDYTDARFVREDSDVWFDDGECYYDNHF